MISLAIHEYEFLFDLLRPPKLHSSLYQRPSKLKNPKP